mmetsp:Transcript_30699/g.80762  ORF Transcript_30699/g.80762 Transcript_30699/m.80762 type:complete len:762 (-) Transcript_30699:930-3215(-)
MSPRGHLRWKAASPQQDLESSHACPAYLDTNLRGGLQATSSAVTAPAGSGAAQALTKLANKSSSVAAISPVKLPYHDTQPRAASQPPHCAVAPAPCRASDQVGACAVTAQALSPVLTTCMGRGMLVSASAATLPAPGVSPLVDRVRLYSPPAVPSRSARQLDRNPPSSAQRMPLLLSSPQAPHTSSPQVVVQMPSVGTGHLGCSQRPWLAYTGKKARQVLAGRLAVTALSCRCQGGGDSRRSDEGSVAWAAEGGGQLLLQGIRWIFSDVGVPPPPLDAPTLCVLMRDFEMRFPGLPPGWQVEPLHCAQGAQHVCSLLFELASNEAAWSPVAPGLAVPVLQTDIGEGCGEGCAPRWTDAYWSRIADVKRVLREQVVDASSSSGYTARNDTSPAAPQTLAARLFKQADARGLGMLSWQAGEIQSYVKLFFEAHGLPAPFCPAAVWYQFVRASGAGPAAVLGESQAASLVKRLLECISSEADTALSVGKKTADAIIAVSLDAEASTAAAGASKIPSAGPHFRLAAEQSQSSTSERYSVSLLPSREGEMEGTVACFVDQEHKPLPLAQNIPASASVSSSREAMAEGRRGCLIADWHQTTADRESVSISGSIGLRQSDSCIAGRDSDPCGATVAGTASPSHSSLVAGRRGDAQPSHPLHQLLSSRGKPALPAIESQSDEGEPELFRSVSFPRGDDPCSANSGVLVLASQQLPPLPSIYADGPTLGFVDKTSRPAEAVISNSSSSSSSNRCKSRKLTSLCFLMVVQT